MSNFIGARHEFHDAAFVQDWADRFVPSAPRLALFDMILEQVRALAIPAASVLELGIGPGYMARHILERHSLLRYEGLDFSEAFFAVARKTLGPLGERVDLTKADLTDASWPLRLARRPDAIISTWALHDLGSEQAIADVYSRCFGLLPEGGLLVNGDFIKPDGAEMNFEPGRFEIARHLQLLKAASFADPASLRHFEPETAQPTAAQNYACLIATK